MSKIEPIKFYKNFKGQVYGLNVAFSNCWTVNGKPLGIFTIKRLRKPLFEGYVVLEIAILSFLLIHIGFQGQVR